MMIYKKNTHAQSKHIDYHSLFLIHSIIFPITSFFSGSFLAHLYSIKSILPMLLEVNPWVSTGPAMLVCINKVCVYFRRPGQIMEG